MLHDNESTPSRPGEGHGDASDATSAAAVPPTGAPAANASADDGISELDFDASDPNDASTEDAGDEDVDDGVREMAAKVHRVPRMGSFMVLGAIVGVVLVLVLTFAFPENDDFTRMQVFGFLAAFTVPITLALGGLAGYIAGRVAAKRSFDARLIRADELENRS